MAAGDRRVREVGTRLGIAVISIVDEKAVSCRKSVRGVGRSRPAGDSSRPIVGLASKLRFRGQSQIVLNMRQSS